jgi:hypothetical protein
MKRLGLIVAFFFCALFVAGEAYAVESVGEVYYIELEKVKKQDPTADFKAMRLAYANTPEYNPYEDGKELREKMNEAYGQKRYMDAIKHAEAILEKNYLNIDAHLICQLAYKMVGNYEKACFHDFVLKGLLTSIVTSGDGITPETAYVVINVREEYIILNLLDAEPKKQSLMELPGHRYDRFDVVDRKTGRVFELYFNVDLPTRWLDKQFFKKEQDK